MITTEIVSIMLPVLVAVAVGFFWSRSGRNYDTELITSLVTYFGTPCLIFHALTSIELSSEAFLMMGGAALASNIVFAIAGGALLAILKLPQRTYLQSLCFPNIGNMGLPLCLFAFGAEGLALAITFFAVFTIFQMTVGIAFVSGSFSLRNLIKMPIIPATILAAGFLLAELPVPRWLTNTTETIGSLTIPLMLITLGVSLARLHVERLKTPLFLGCARLILGVLVGLLLAHVFQLQGVAAGVVILQCSMPTAVFSYLFAQHYDRSPEDIAGIVVSSTLLAFLFLPILLLMLLK